MTRILSTLSIFFMFIGVSFGQVPEQKIVGTDGVKNPGELVVLGLTDYQKPENLVDTSVSWYVETYQSNTESFVSQAFMNADSRIFFSTGVTQDELKGNAKPRYFYVRVAVAYVFNENGKPKVYNKLLNAKIQVNEGKPKPPEPGPNPNPEPQPKPDLPEGKYGLAPFVYNTAKAHVDTKHYSVAKKLAENYANVASRIGAGTLKDPKEILNETTNSNTRTLANAGLSSDVWLPFFTALQEKAWQLYSDKKITNAEDFRVAWNEIELGLKAISGE